MAGHSKWSTIKRKKAATDAKRGKLFTRLLKEVQMAAKLGGGNPDANPRLRTAIQAAKAQSVPSDNIDRSIKRGTGDLEGVDYEEVTYEGYGPGGVAILIKSLTDNKNRTVAEVRHCLSKHGGSLAGSNAVAYLFEDKGIFTVSKSEASEEELYEVVLEAGAEDVKDEGDIWEINCPLNEFGAVRDALEQSGKTFEGEIQSVPETTVMVEGSDAESTLKLMDALDDLDDVQSVTANFEMDEETMAAMEQGS